MDQSTTEDIDEIDEDDDEEVDEDGEDEMGFDLNAEDDSSHDDRPYTTYTCTRGGNTPADQMVPPIPTIIPPTSTWHSHRENEPETETVSVPFLLMTATDKDMFLWSPSATCPATATLLTNALHQEVPEGSLAHMEHFSRLNMTAQIPELGIVIVASQAGCVALLTLTRLQYKRSSQCSFRLDWILPFKSQEQQGLRPTFPLLGFAVGPIQGQESKQEGVDRDSPARRTRSEGRRGEVGRRYRLILEYFDRTILAYEIGRKDEGEEEVLVF